MATPSSFGQLVEPTALQLQCGSCMKNINGEPDGARCGDGACTFRAVIARARSARRHAPRLSAPPRSWHARCHAAGSASGRPPSPLPCPARLAPGTPAAMRQAARPADRRRRRPASPAPPRAVQASTLDALLKAKQFICPHCKSHQAVNLSEQQETGLRHQAAQMLAQWRSQQQTAAWQQTMAVQRAMQQLRAAQASVRNSRPGVGAQSLNGYVRAL